MSQAKTVAIIGAGPVGLAAAAHVLERGIEPIVLEAGETVGHAMRQWGHVQLFSPWEYNIDKAAGRLLAATGWNSPEPDQYPTGAEMVERYLEPLAHNTALKQHIQTSSRVTGISRTGFDKMKTKGREAAPFEIRYQNGQGPKVIKADAVIDASGTWHSPNPAGANGLAAIGERDVADRIAYGMPDVLGKQRARYAGKTVAVLGAGHSAIGTLIDLAKLAERRPAPVRSGCCAAAIPPRRSAAASMTSWSRGVNLAAPSRALSPTTRSSSNGSFVFPTSPWTAAGWASVQAVAGRSPSMN